MIVQVEGLDVHCHTGGRGFNPLAATVVLVHGALNDHTVWRLQSRHVAARGLNVLAPDLPGHGRSKGAAKDSVEAMAAWLLALLGAAGVAAQAHIALVGHSMGAMVALEAAHMAPARVQRLALLGATFPMRVSPQLLASAKDDEQRAIDMVATWSHSPAAQQPARAQPGPGWCAMEGTRRLMQRVARLNPRQLLHTDLSACNAYANGLVAARSLRCPALFILGTRDAMTPPRSATQLIAAMAQASVLQVEAGHQMMAEQPDAVSEALYRFASGRA